MPTHLKQLWHCRVSLYLKLEASGLGIRHWIPLKKEGKTFWGSHPTEQCYLRT